MEKQEVEMKWKLETETGNWKQKQKRNLLATVVIHLFLGIPVLSPPPVFAFPAPLVVV